MRLRWAGRCFQRRSPYGIAKKPARNRGHNRHQSDAKRLAPRRQDHRNEHDIRWDRKERAFYKGDNGQGPKRPRMLSQRQGPGIKAMYHVTPTTILRVFAMDAPGWVGAFPHPRGQSTFTPTVPVIGHEIFGR